jgi:hypothetical protein
MDRQKKLIIRLGLGALLVASLVVLMLEIFGEPGAQAQNARTLTQLQQYVTALELVRSENGLYPITHDFVCLGDYTDNTCWDKGGAGIKEDEMFNDALDAFVPILSAGRMVTDERNPDESREGYIYRSKSNGRGYEIQYLLVGKDKRCGFGADLSLDTIESRRNNNTFCAIIR